MSRVVDISNSAATITISTFTMFLIARAITAELLLYLVACKALSEAAIAQKIGGAVEFGYSTLGCALRIALFAITFGIMAIVFLVLRSEFHRKGLWRAFAGIFSTATHGGGDSLNKSTKSAQIAAEDAATGALVSPPVQPAESAPASSAPPAPQPLSPAELEVAAVNRVEAKLVAPFAEDEFIDKCNFYDVGETHTKLAIISLALSKIGPSSSGVASDRIAASDEAKALIAAVKDWDDNQLFGEADKKMEAAFEAAERLVRAESEISGSARQLLPKDEYMENAQLKSRAQGIRKDIERYTRNMATFKYNTTAPKNKMEYAALYVAIAGKPMAEVFDIFDRRNLFTEHLPAYCERILDKMEALLSELGSNSSIPIDAVREVDQAFLEAHRDDPDRISETHLADACLEVARKKEEFIVAGLLRFHMSCAIEGATERMLMERKKFEISRKDVDPPITDRELHALGLSSLGAPFDAFTESDETAANHVSVFGGYFDQLKCKITGSGDEVQKLFAATILCLQITCTHCRIIRATIDAMMASDKLNEQMGCMKELLKISENKFYESV
ncbi:MAG: hypothetical protein LBB38_04115, partial [Puniceicoccales bacterium]|nr:hypothetical protein [Puniceicoccales bacterium]